MVLNYKTFIWAGLGMKACLITFIWAGLGMKAVSANLWAFLSMFLRTRQKLNGHQKNISSRNIVAFLGSGCICYIIGIHFFSESRTYT